MAWIPLATAAVSAMAGAQGAKKAASATRDAQNISDKAAEQIYGLDVPDVSELRYDPTRSEYAGDVNPQLLSNLQDIESQFGGISTDPRFAQAQYQSLGGLDELIAGGGQTAADKLAYQQATNDAASQASREQGNITRDMAERGLGGSGQEMAMRLASSQGAANRGADAAQTQAATAQQRALDAMIQRGELAGNMQGADFDRQAKIAEATDRIRQWNRDNSMQVQQNNATMLNQAKTGNRDARQANTNLNAGIDNTGKQVGVNAVQDTYNNKMDKAVAGGNAATGQANSRLAAAQNTKDMWSGIASAAPGVINAGVTAWNAPAAKSPVLTDDQNTKSGSAWA